MPSSPPPSSLVIEGARVVDLSYAYDEETIFWPTEDGFTLEKEFDGITPGGFYYAANRFKAPEHGGTHIDAPVHFAKGKATVDQLPLRRLMGPAVVIDVTAQCAKDRDYRITIADLEAWEAAHGVIPDGAIVILRTGFGRFWPDREKYMGTAERGAEAVKKLHFPGLHPSRRRMAHERAEHPRRRTRYPQHRSRPVDDLRHAPCALRARRPGVRKPREPRATSGDWRDGDRATHEDQRRERRPAARGGDRSAASLSHTVLGGTLHDTCGRGARAEEAPRACRLAAPAPCARIALTRPGNARYHDE